MRPDIRNTVLTRFEEGMAEIRLSRHQLRSNVIVSLRDTQHDIYMDVQDSSEEFRALKVALVNRNPDMMYVQELFDELSMPDDILPFTVILTAAGLPRNPHINDYVIVDGRIYVVSKVKPTNRDLGRVLNLLVYPMRDERYIEDPLAIYDIRFQNGMYEVPVDKIYDGPFVMSLVYGGCPVKMSFDGEQWFDFRAACRLNLKEGMDTLYLMDGLERVVSRRFNEEVDEPETDNPSQEDNVKYL